ncbi:unnamed protein product [Victoria cruziana]
MAVNPHKIETWPALTSSVRICLSRVLHFNTVGHIFTVREHGLCPQKNRREEGEEEEANTHISLLHATSPSQQLAEEEDQETPSLFSHGGYYLAVSSVVLGSLGLFY